jgi:hypothetical protein
LIVQEVLSVLIVQEVLCPASLSLGFGRTSLDYGLRLRFGLCLTLLSCSDALA